MLRINLVLAFFLLQIHSHGQTKWTLAKCLDYVQKRNLYLKQANLAELALESKFQLAVKDKNPSISAGIVPNYYYGRAIDPATYQFVEKGLFNNNIYINSSMTLYNGGKKNNAVQQAQIEKDIAGINTKKLTQDLFVSLTQNYVQILMLDDQLQIAKDQLETSRKQSQKINLSNTSHEYNDVWEAQVAMDELAVVKAQNELNNSKLAMASLMDLPDFESFEIEPLSKNIPMVDNIGNDAESIYYKVLTQSPQVKMNTMQEKLFALQFDAAKNAKKPSLMAFANALTYYSSNFKQVQDAKIARYDTTLFYANNKIQLGLQPVYDYRLQTIPLLNQFAKTANINLGLSFVLPIYGGYQHKNAVNQAKINLLRQELSSQIAKKELKKDVYQLFANYQAALKQYEAANKSMLAWKKALNNSLIKLQDKNPNLAEYESTKTNYYKSEQSLRNAKYDFFLRKSLFEIYKNNNNLE